MSAHLGNAFEIPLSSFADDKTMAGTSYAPSFHKSEKAERKKPFETFYTVNQTKGGIEKVQFTEKNRFEGRSSYYHYYPTDSIVE
jgi:hypothetical protein